MTQAHKKTLIYCCEPHIAMFIAEAATDAGLNPTRVSTLTEAINLASSVAYDIYVAEVNGTHPGQPRVEAGVRIYNTPKVRDSLARGSRFIGTAQLPNALDVFNALSLKGAEVQVKSNLADYNTGKAFFENLITEMNRK